MSQLPLALQGHQPKKLVVGAPGRILTFDYDLDGFHFTSSHEAPGTTPSWMVFIPPNRLYAVDESSAFLRLFLLDENLRNPILYSVAQGAYGVVHLELNADGTRMVGCGYGSGLIDIWDLTAPYGSPRLMRQKTVPGAAERSEKKHMRRPHQAVLEPRGRYFLINDLGHDQILVLDSAGDSWEFVGRSFAMRQGCGPRHGAFVGIQDEDPQAHYYAVACERANTLDLIKLFYKHDGLQFRSAAKGLSTFFSGLPADKGKKEFPKPPINDPNEVIVISDDDDDADDDQGKKHENEDEYEEDLTTPTKDAAPAAGGIVVAGGRDVYVSNRLTGRPSDSIAGFHIEPRFQSMEVVPGRMTLSRGRRPRMLSLGLDGEGEDFDEVGGRGSETLFVANQEGHAHDRHGGEGGGVLAAFRRDPLTGKLSLKAVVRDLDPGPMFVQEIRR
ncbi:Lactonase, 7-bladed beta-propeller-domain-containing protein [Xylariaceae sp. FL0804]|nr:Lactonase, 7-bladed beta-propeller-domain-containing protein [Xylariaceae sp. FL0804]